VRLGDGGSMTWLVGVEPETMSTSSCTADSWPLDCLRRSKYGLDCAMSVAGTVAVLASLDHKRLIHSAPYMTSPAATHSVRTCRKCVKLDLRRVAFCTAPT